MSNGSLLAVLVEKKLFQGPEDWPKVAQMTLDAATGLAHLHRERVCPLDGLI